MAATTKNMNTKAAKKGGRAKSTSKSRSRINDTRNRSNSGQASGRKRKDIVKTHQRKIEDVNDYRDQMAFEAGVTMLVIAIFSIFLYVSYFKLGGIVGKIFGGLSFGIFGWAAWIVPTALFIGYVFITVNKGDRRVPRKVLSLTAAILFLLGLTDLLLKPEIITEYYTSNHVLHHGYFECMGMTLEDVLTDGKMSGGLLGRGVANIFSMALGKVGACILMIALFLLCIYIFNGIEFMRAIRKRNAYRQEMESTYEEILEDHDYREPSYSVINRPVRQRPVIKSDRPLQAVNLMQMSSKLDEMEAKDKAERIKSRKTIQKIKKTSVDDKMQEIIEPKANQAKSTVNEDKFPESETISETMAVSEEVQEMEKIPIYREELDKKFGGKKSLSAVSKPVQSMTSAPQKPKIQNDSKPQPIKTVPARELLKPDTLEPEKVPAKLPKLEKEVRVKKNTEEAPEHIEELPQNNDTYVAKPVYDDNISYKKTEKTTNHGRIGGEDYVSKSSTYNALNDSKAEAASEEKKREYQFPSIELLSEPVHSENAMSDEELRKTAMKLQDTLQSFNVNVKMGAVTCGPTVTRYELLPEQGVRVNKITNLADDLKLSLAASSIRIEAPIPGKSAVGIEVPNRVASSVYFRELLEGETFNKAKSPVTFAVGKDIAGKVIMTDISKMPHLLIAGSTGSGKSVCINTLIMSILYKANPDDVKLIMIDPKVVELSVYNGIPHLFCPVVTDPKEAAAALNWSVREMTDRYNKFRELGVRNIAGYNEKIKTVPDSEKAGYPKMPFLVVIVDEFADLMMVASKEVEDAVCRLAQLARAAGIHLVLATQRPSVNVITGIIKANIPSRIAFSVSSAIDSRTIIDKGGAEKLLGKGDMLFFPAGYSEPVRVQGAFVSDEEVSSVVEFLRSNNEEPEYNHAVTEVVTTESQETTGEKASKPDRDEYFEEAGRFVIESERAAAGQLQRKFSIGFNRAGRIIDQLHKAGVVGPAEGTKPRKILMTMQEFNLMVGGGDPVSEEELDSVAQEFSDENDGAVTHTPDIYGGE